MAVFPSRRGLVACLAASAGFGCWYLTEATGLERQAFAAVIGGYTRPPFFLTGNGTREQPWRLRALAVKARIDACKAPVVVSIGDDPDGVFQSSPPSPVDLAVVLRNLQRLGAKQAAIAAVMAWEKPDPVALKGLDIVLNEFQMVVHAAPLARGTVRQAMPPAFRRASLAPETIQGDCSKLPIVNRVAVADVIFGGERALAGFTSVDNVASGGDKPQLLVRWEEDRVLLAFPLLAVLARYDLPVEGIQVRLGEFLQLGPQGPVVPIDEDGRMALPLKPVASRVDVSAESLITGTPEIFPAAPGLIVLRDDQSNAPSATRKFSATLAAAIASIGSDAGLGPASSYCRLSATAEVALLAGLAAGLALIAGWPRFQRYLACGILAAAALAAQWLVLGLAQVWLPGLPLLATLVAAATAMDLLEKVRPAARATFPGAVGAAAGRTFRTVTIWREPRRQVPETACVSEPPPGPLDPLPIAAETAKGQRKPALRKAAAKASPHEAIPTPAAVKRAARKTAPKPAAEAKAKAGKAPAATPPPEA